MHRGDIVFYVYRFDTVGVCAVIRSLVGFGRLWAFASVLHDFMILMTIETPAASSRGGISNK